MKLYDYYRSSACYRVRIALNVKQLDYERIEVHLTNNGGEHNKQEYKEINPQGLVPTLEINGEIITQSLAIIEYLDEVYPQIPLLGKDPLRKAKARSLALIIACEVHPLNNLRALNRLKEQFQASESEVMDWYFHWLKAGFDAFEAKLATLDRSHPFCMGNNISLPDVCLIPQVYNAHRFHFPMDNYPIINEINAHCSTLEPFQKAVP